MKRLITLTATLLLTLMAAPTLSAQSKDYYEEMIKATTWYADRCESIITRFEGLRHDSGQLLQKYCMYLKDDVSEDNATADNFALVLSTWDERMMVMFTPDGNDVSGKVITKDKLTKDYTWDGISNLLKYATSKNDITLKERPLPVRHVDQKRNSYVAVVDLPEKITDISLYNQMIFKPHKNAVKLVKQEHLEKKDEAGNMLHDEMEYTFRLVNPAIKAKMFRGYGDYEMTPWIVKTSFFAHHNILQFSRWKEGEAIRKATPDVCRIISDYYGGRKIKDAQWLATVEISERSFYAVQFEHQNGDALGALVCLAEGMVASVWEFHSSMTPVSDEELKEGQSLWFVDDEGDFISHAPELQCVVATDKGLELYLRLFGGESIQYYILREMGEVMMELQTDYYITVW